jgi:hypothetical protein
MISACGLIVLALYNRFAVLMNNLRNCLEACRRESLPLAPDPAIDDTSRTGCEHRRAQSLFHKLRLLRRALICLLLCIVCMVLCSLAISASMIVPSAERLALIFFLAGMANMLLGVTFALRDLLHSLQGLSLPQQIGVDHPQRPRQAA